MIDGKTWEYLKANILEWWSSITNTADMEIVSNAAEQIFKNNKNMSGVMEISFSVSYNPETWKPADSQVLLPGWTISEISNQAGISTYIVNFPESLNIAANTQIVSFIFEKQVDETAFLNLMNVNFKDASWEVFLLSSSWTMF